MSITKILINWYNTFHRNLPWRNSKAPYVIWVSEIILQQTQVKQGLPYYNKFINRFPTIESLAKANEDDVLLLWQGLGYYSRARNMQTAAKQVMCNYKGTFPTTYNDIIKLKGVGEYTAAAIASFCFGEAKPAIDGNVNRVISRLFNVAEPIDTQTGKAIIKEISEQLIPKNDAATYNQSIMEFGATICSPKNPTCTQCPLLNKCEAHKAGTISMRPVKKNKTNQQNRYFTYLVFIDNNNTFISKRSKKDIWKGLFEFPLIETKGEMGIDDLKNNLDFKNYIEKASINKIEIMKSAVHILSHQKIHSYFVIIYGLNFNTEKYIKISIEKLSSFAFPVLIKKFIQKLQVS